MYPQAKKKVLEIIADDNKWNLFVQQVGQHEIDLRNSREIARTSKDYRIYLQGLYIHYSATQICELCDYNPHQRKGKGKFLAKRRFDCNWRKTKGDVLAEETARKKGQEGVSLYKFNDPEWTARYEKLSQAVSEQHIDRTKAPPWLDVKKNLCPHYYIDESRSY